MEVTVGFKFFLCLKIIFMIFALSKLSSLRSHCFSGFFGLGFGNDGMSGTPSNMIFGLESFELIWMVFVSELELESRSAGGGGGLGLGWPGLR